MDPIGFLHTSSTHVARFDALVEEIAPGTPTVSVVAPELLALAEQHGPQSVLLHEELDAALGRVEGLGAGVVLCTCSSIGDPAEKRGTRRAPSVMRVDRPMAESAVRQGPRIAVVAALDVTFTGTARLVESAAAAVGQPIVMSEHLVEGAWQHFLAGDTDRYLQLTAEECDRLAGSCDVVVLAQASMQGATELVSGEVTVLDSPRSGVVAAVAELRRVNVRKPTLRAGTP